MSQSVAQLKHVVASLNQQLKDLEHNIKRLEKNTWHVTNNKTVSEITGRGYQILVGRMEDNIPVGDRELLAAQITDFLNARHIY